MEPRRFWEFRAADNNPKAGELRLYGPISSQSWWGDEVTPKQFKQELDALGSLDELHVFINSDGGDVFAGQAIHSMLRRHKATVIVYVDGLAASIASVVAMAGNIVRMPRNAMMMIHNPWTVAGGNADDFRKMADDLDQIRESILTTYEDKTGMKRDELIPLLDAETWLTAEEAVAMGFADEIEASKQVAASVVGGRLAMNGQVFDLSKYHNPPAIAAVTAPVDAAGPPSGQSTGPAYDVGARVIVPGAPHVDGQLAGEVREAVLTYSYGIIFDGMEDMGIHHWYVESELVAAGPSDALSAGAGGPANQRNKPLNQSRPQETTTQPAPIEARSRDEPPAELPPAPQEGPESDPPVEPPQPEEPQGRNLDLARRRLDLYKRRLG